MIKTIQLLRESCATYKSNFKNIFMMSLPIVLMTYVANYAAGEASGMLNARIFNGSLIVCGAVFIIAMLIVALFLAPALNRAVQKHEDGEAFNVKGGYDFMKTHKWKWVKVNVWGALYMLYRTWFYIIPGWLLIAYSVGSYRTNAYTSLYFILGIVLIVIGILLNIHRFILFKTIFLSKDISPRDAVRESMSLGVSRMKDVWKMLLAMILVGLVIGVLSAIVSGIASFFGATDYVFDGYISPLIALLITTPMLLIMTAKGYVKLRG